MMTNWGRVLCKNLKFKIFLIVVLFFFTFTICRLFSLYNYEANDLPKQEVNNIPKQEVMSENEIFDVTEKETNIAIKYWSQWKTYENKSESESEWRIRNITTCDTALPSPHLLKYNSIYWQTIETGKDIGLYLYNAYYDSRETTRKVRIIGVTDRFAKLKDFKFWCLLYFEDKRKPILSTVSMSNMWYNYLGFWSKSGVYLPVMISCDIPNDIKDYIPKAIALITKNSCDVKLENYLRVIYEKPIVKKQFGVCVQALRFGHIDLSVRLIEWLELLRILGADKVFLHSYSTHKNMEKVMDYYSEQGFVDWKRIALPGPQINARLLINWYHDSDLKRFWPQEILELNDCFYRNIYNYEYIAILDIDEVIVPVKAHNWSQLLTDIKDSIKDDNYRESLATFSNLNGRVYADIEDDKFEHYLYTMRHNYRQEVMDFNVKCFHVTKNVEVAVNHRPWLCLKRNESAKCLNHDIDTEQSYFLHYKREVKLPENCQLEDKRKCAIYDPILLKHYQQLNRQMKIAFKNIF